MSITNRQKKKRDHPVYSAVKILQKKTERARSKQKEVAIILEPTPEKENEK